MHATKRWEALVSASICLLSWAYGSAPVLTTSDWPGLLVMNPAIPQSIVAGYPYRYVIRATGANSYDAQGLPPELTVDHTYGVISGTLQSAGSFPITLSATNADGTTTGNVTLNVNPPPTAAPVMSQIADRSTFYSGAGQPALAPDEQLTGSTVAFVLHASNYPRTYTASGLPQGASLFEHGFIYYAPNSLQPGKHTVTVTATNDIGSGSTSFHWDVYPAVTRVSADKTLYAYGDPIVITAQFDGPVVVTGTPYVPVRSGTRQATYVSGSGTNALTFRYVTSAADGDFTETVANHIELNGGSIQSPDGLSATLTDLNAPNGYVWPPYTVTGSGNAAPAVQPLPNGIETDVAYWGSQVFGQRPMSATNSPTSWSATGTPPNVAFSTTTGTFSWDASHLSGGEYNVTVTATNSAGSGSTTFTWKIHPALADFITTDKYQYTTGDTITFIAKFSSNVIVTGSPYLPLWNDKKAMYAAGSGSNMLTFTYTVAADDPVGGHNAWQIEPGDGAITTPGGTIATLTPPEAPGVPPPQFGIVLSSVPAPAIANQTINGTAGAPLSAQIAATNATSYHVISGFAPDFITIDASTGAVTGTPHYAGTTTVILQVSNAGGATASANITFAIAPTAPPPPPVTLPPPSPTKSDQSITFSSPVSAIIVGQPITLGATSSAGLPVTYAIVSGDATITGNTLTPLSTAPLVVRAYSSGNDTYNAAFADVNFGPPQKAAQAITMLSTGGDVVANNAVALAATSSSGQPVTYAVVSGPATITGSTLSFTGTGTVVVRASQSGSDTVAAANDVTVTYTAHPIPRLVNISSRLHLTAGDTAIAGFVVTGSAPKKMLIRAVGDSLVALGVGDPLANPRLTVFDNDRNPVATNSGWAGDPQIAAAGDAVGAFSLKSGSSDAALVATLAPGPYTAQVTSGSTGTVLLEVYDLGAEDAVPTKQLVNVSTRSRVDASNPIIQGFVVSGDQPKRVLIRAVGAPLSQFGVTDAIADPVLKLYSGSTVVAQNDDWSTPQPMAPSQALGTATDIAAASAATGAFPLPSGSKDAALLITLPPGPYTVVVPGSAAQSGEVLVEAYDVP